MKNTPEEIGSDLQQESTSRQDGEQPAVDDSKKYSVDWVGSIPYIVIHAGCLAVFLPQVGISWIAVGCALLLYFARMFFLSLIHI